MTNAITHIEIEDFRVFKGKLSLDFCPGVNVLLGGNGTGKTTLMRWMYHSTLPNHYDDPSMIPTSESIGWKQIITYKFGKVFFRGPDMDTAGIPMMNRGVYIPEKDILEHSKGLLTFIEDKQTGFSKIYKDILIKAQDVPTNKQTEVQKSIGRTISDLIGGEVKWDKGDGSFYTVKTDGTRIPFANEASGFKKFGFLGLLVACGQLAPGSILFWDEPENSLNPELVPVLVNILLELSQNGIQIFVATHSYDVARWFELNKTDKNYLRYFNLRKEGEGVVADVSDDYISLDNNPIDAADDNLLRRVVEVSAIKAGVKLK
jgi:energy-coupling factor transporter ATP-binding protein EcfA2